MNDCQAWPSPLVLTAAMVFFGLVHSSGAQTPTSDAPAVSSPAPFPASPPPGAPIPGAAARIIPPETFEEPLIAAPEAAAPVPTPAPRLIPPEVPGERSIRQPPATATPSPAPQSSESAEEAPPRVPAQPMPADEAACRARLSAMGVEFEERPPVSEPSGCAIENPVAVTALSPEIALEPEALLNCPMAEAVARFARDIVAPAAQEIFGSELASIRHASAYVCRPRNGSAKLSEHASGNALDFGAFTLSDGRVTTVESTGDPKEQTFLTRLRKAACGPFKTVLGPGSDADHATHFHFDLQPRRAGSTWCQ